MMRMHRFIAGGAVATFAAACSTSALATLTLTDGNALYVSTVPTTAIATGGGLADFRPEGGTTTDSLFRSTWHWRVNGVDTREFAFSSESGFGFSETSNGNVGTRSWIGLGGGRFNAMMTVTLTDGAVAGAALLSQQLTITNTSQDALDLSLFNFADFDVAGTFGGDVATLGGPNLIDVVDGANTAQWLGVGADAYQVTAFNSLYTSLTNASVTNLDFSGLPFGPGDFTAAFQWDRVLGVGPGQSVTVTTLQGIGQAVPAPGALAVLGMAGLCGRRRRRA